MHCRRVSRVPAGIVNSLTSRHAPGLCVGVGEPLAVSEVEGVAVGVPLEVPPEEKVVEGVRVPEGVAEAEGEPVGEGEGVGDCEGEGGVDGVTDGVGEAEGAAREKLKSYGQENNALLAHSAHTQQVVPEAQAVGPKDHVAGSLPDLGSVKSSSANSGSPQAPASQNAPDVKKKVMIDAPARVPLFVFHALKGGARGDESNAASSCNWRGSRAGKEALR